MCYIEVTSDGVVTHGTDSETYRRAVAGESRLFAVWPGNWSSHLFAIDDLEEYAKALGIVHDEDRTGLADHNHQVSWSVSPYEKKPSGSYISIEIRFECGCELRDLKAFADHMKRQKGWDIATSGGWSGHGTTYTVRARRRSLES